MPVARFRYSLTATLLVALMCPAYADPVKVLTGTAAYGDWRADAPGLRRKITPTDLPAPLASAPVANPSRAAKRPMGANPRVPDGFTAEMFASGLEEPRVLRTAPNGDIFLAETGAGRIRIIRGADGAAAQAASHVFASGFERPYGIAFYPLGPEPRFVYVATPGEIVRFPFKLGDLKPSGPAERVAALPEGDGHWTRDLAFSADGRTLFASVGSGSNVADDMDPLGRDALAQFERTHVLGAAWGTEARRADVLAFDPDGKHERVVATGLRNCSGMAVQPETSGLWCAVNERDLLGDDLPPDYATQVFEGKFYGWPWYYIGDHEDPRLKGDRPDLASQVTVPHVLLQPHSAPLGIAFYEGDQFPATYKGSAFVTLHGSWNRDKRTGYKVVRLLFDNGKPTGEYEDFLIGFVEPNDSVWGRPVGVTVTKDGALLVSDDEGGAIWRIGYPHR